MKIDLIRPSFIYNQKKNNCIEIGGINILSIFKDYLYQIDVTYEFLPNNEFLGEMIEE